MKKGGTVSTLVDTLVYEFFDLGVPSSEKQIACGTSITCPGTVAEEYFMDWEAQELATGMAVYVPASCARRSINLSRDEPLVTRLERLVSL